MLARKDGRKSNCCSYGPRVQWLLRIALAAAHSFKHGYSTRKCYKHLKEAPWNNVDALQTNRVLQGKIFFRGDHIKAKRLLKQAALFVS